MRIDSHAHIGTWKGLFIPRVSEEEFIRRMDELKIDVSCVSSMEAIQGEIGLGNEEVRAMALRHPKRILPYAVVGPGGVCSTSLVKIHPYCFSAGPDRYEELWASANEARSIVLTHTWGGDPYCSPKLFAPVARRYPNLAILLGHSGNNLEGAQECIDATKTTSNMYLELATSWVHFGMIERLVREAGAERIVFGTDMTFLEPAASVARLEHANIGEIEREAIFGGNMRRLLSERGVRLES